MITTGEFQSWSIAAVTVNPGRQRQNPSDIQPLAASIAERGLINPITITRQGVLVAGERRLLACRALGWDRIPVQTVDESVLDDESALEELEMIELEENTKRQDLTWQEINDAYARLYEIRKRREPAATLEEIARSVGLKSKGNLSDHLAVHRERQLNPALAGADTFVSARQKAQASQRRREADELNDLLGSTIEPCTPVLNTSFHDWAAAYSGPKFNLLHCDFPYGINAQDSGVNPAGYDDSLGVYLELLKTLAIYLENFCAESAHIIFWFSPKHYLITWENLKLLDGFVFDEVPLVWHKSDGKGIAPDPTRRPRRVYETAFFGWRGGRGLTALRDNLFSAPTERQRHPHEKSELALRHFFSMVVDGNTRLLDPTCGSGSALRAARALGAKAYLGLELDEGYADEARRSLAAVE